MSQRTEGGHNHVLDKIQTDKKFRTHTPKKKTLQLASFMNLFLKLVHNENVRAV